MNLFLKSGPPLPFGTQFTKAQCHNLGACHLIFTNVTFPNNVPFVFVAHCESTEEFQIFHTWYESIIRQRAISKVIFWENIFLILIIKIYKSHGIVYIGVCRFYFATNRGLRQKSFWFLKTIYGHGKKIVGMFTLLL